MKKLIQRIFGPPEIVKVPVEVHHHHHHNPVSRSEVEMIVSIIMDRMRKEPKPTKRKVRSDNKSVEQATKELLKRDPHPKGL